MTVLVLDSGGLSRLSEQKQENVALIAVLSRDGYRPPVVISVVLAESISGRQHTDANTNRLLKRCDIVTDLPERLARRAGVLRSAARRGYSGTRVVQPSLYFLRTWIIDNRIIRLLFNLDSKSDKWNRSVDRSTGRNESHCHDAVLP